MARRVALVDYHAMRKEFDNASDRAVAILGAAYVEEALLDALLVRLGIDTLSTVEELIGNGAPLGTFSNKIIIAESVRLIGPRTRGDLDRIRKIRNECAHAVNPVAFSDQRLKDLISALTPRTLPVPNMKAELPDVSKPRERFQECCHQIYDELYNDDRTYAYGAGREIPFGPELD
jgi:hypothetical protein